MPSKLAKVQKHVTKKKGSKQITSLHENSRDAKRLRRAGMRDDRVSQKNATRERANRAWIERIAFFQDRLPETLHPLEMETITELIEEYVGRHDGELSKLKEERRAGRPASTRQTVLEQVVGTERAEFESGLWMPNLQDGETLVRLEAWGGDWAGLANLRWVRVARGGEVKESQFPPRGAS